MDDWLGLDGVTADWPDRRSTQCAELVERWRKEKHRGRMRNVGRLATGEGGRAVLLRTRPVTPPSSPPCAPLRALADGRIDDALGGTHTLRRAQRHSLVACDSACVCG